MREKVIVVPPKSLTGRIHEILYGLLRQNPAATSSEKYVQNHLEFELIKTDILPRYAIRIGINYHGTKVQQIGIDGDTGALAGWNPSGDALGTGINAKMLLAGHTIYNRDPDEPHMSDTKILGGDVPSGRYVRAELKARGWLGQTKNLDGAQLEKDLDLLKNGLADLLVIALSETAHRKWRGEGPSHQAVRRTGVQRFVQILVDVHGLDRDSVLEREITFEGQPWTVSSQRVTGDDQSLMPGAEHIVTLCWRRDQMVARLPSSPVPP